MILFFQNFKPPKINEILIVRQNGRTKWKATSKTPDFWNTILTTTPKIIKKIRKTIAQKSKKSFGLLLDVNSFLKASVCFAYPHANINGVPIHGELWACGDDNDLDVRSASRNFIPRACRPVGRSADPVGPVGRFGPVGHFADPVGG